MKRTWALGSCLCISIAVGVVGAGSAGALPPEVGRCVAKAGGKYSSATCTTTAGKGSFEFEKNPVKKGFKGEGGEDKILFASGDEIKCTQSSLTGEYHSTSATTEVRSVREIYRGCELPLFKTTCQTKGAAAGEVIGKLLDGKLYYTSGKGTKTPVVNLGLTPEVKKKGFAEFECPAIGVVVYFGEGKEKGHETVLASLGPVNTMATAYTQVYAAGGKAGEQWPNFIEGKPTVIDNMESSLAGPKGIYERVSQVLENVITNEEELEIKA